MLISAILLSVLMALVCYYDATRYLIPNWLVGLVMVLYPTACLMMESTPDWQGALVAFGGLFLFGIILFAGNIMGGGDVKLLAACGLWTGTQALVSFLIATSLLGGALTLLLILGRPVLGYLWLRFNSTKVLPRIFEKSAPIPYGLAIAGAMLMALWNQQLPGMSF